MAIEYLDDLQYSDDRKGPFALYIYNAEGFHAGAQWFSRAPLRYPDEEITVEKATNLARVAFMSGKEVRVTDSGDRLVYHCKDWKCLWPDGGNHGDFWNQIQEAKPEVKR
jgi:hypothetical protein